MMKALLVGNPNSGKTTLFNLLTGSKARVGNFPGVTVEHLEADVSIGGQTLHLTDLPGIYSLNPDTLEQRVCRDYIEKNPSDIIINILDATNLERNLFLTLQLKEYGIPMILVLNMIDETEKLNITIDVHALSRMLDMPVVAISASKNRGVQDLTRLIAHFFTDNEALTHRDHDDVINREDCTTAHCASCHNQGCHSQTRHNHKNERHTEGTLFKLRHFLLHRRAHEKMQAKITGLNDAATVTLIKESEERYEQIEHIIHHCVQKTHQASNTLTAAIDKVLLNRFLSIPAFILIMYGMFALTFGGPVTFLSDLLDGFINETLTTALSSFLTAIQAPSPLISLLCDGIIAGVGAVICFLPQITVLFLLLSLLEDSGYLSRAAFLCDRIFERLGLSGKAFIPLLMGFGCAVPAVMSARIMKNEKERRLTIMLTPFISCSAKLPVYALFAGLFFKGYEGFVVLGLYLTGIVIAFLSAAALSKTMLKGNYSAFILEMPPYRFPTLKNLLGHTLDRVKGFVQKAGTILLFASIIIWFLQSFTPSFTMTDQPDQSILAQIGRFIAPIFAPIGFGNWQSATALLVGVSAKELIVSTLSVLGSGNEGALLQSLFTPLSAISFLVFSLLYMPCLSTIVVMKKELGSLKWTAFSLLFAFGTAYVVCLAVFQLGSILF